jgi:nitroimidazol reductase NimA-like FMN-containing flavoprotein (pyridoxamine 5'-phosphate oxidase superfamily)
LKESIMSLIEGRSRLELLSPIACDRHLRSEEIGRVALMVDDDHPEIFPVNYAVDDRGDIFFRTDPGTKLDAVSKAPMIALEIDGIDEERQLGWSVLVVGEARHLGLPDEIVAVRSMLQPWASGDKAQVVRLRPTKMSGRRLYRPSSRLRVEGRDCPTSPSL